MPGQRIVTYHYTPDKLNRSSMSDTATGQTASYTFSPLNQYTAWEGWATVTTTTLISPPGKVLAGRMTRRTGWCRPRTPAWPRLPEVELIYDGLGRCVKRTIQGVATIIIYDAWKPIAEWDGWTEEYFQAWNVYGLADESCCGRREMAMSVIIRTRMERGLSPG